MRTQKSEVKSQKLEVLQGNRRHSTASSSSLSYPRQSVGRGLAGAGCLVILLTFNFLLLTSPVSGDSRVEIQNGMFYVDGDPFMVRGVGYYGIRPHQRPGVSYVEANLKWTEADFKRMKAAHINTVRTWDALAPAELALAKKYDLMVLQGIWLDPRQNFSDPYNLQSALRQVKAVAEKSKDFDNVLGYLLMTEPAPDIVLQSGEQDTLQFFESLKKAIQTIDPRPVSMDSWLSVAFLDHSLYDFQTFNIFAFGPKSINHALGLSETVKWLKQTYAKDKPLIIGETGGYAVSVASTSTHFGGVGGLSEYDQSIKDLQSLREVLAGGADGACLVSWIDTWHYPIDPDTHDDEPWEWDGILGIPTDAKRDLIGKPRRIYEDLTRYHLLLPVAPEADGIYGVNVPIPLRAYAPSIVNAVEYRLNGGSWYPLRPSGRGTWQGFVKLPTSARKRQHIEFRALDDTSTMMVEKTVSILTAVPEESITLSNPVGSPPSFTAKVTQNGKPLAKRKIDFGCFSPIGWKETQGTVVSNAQGEASITCALPFDENDAHYLIAAGMDSLERKRTGVLHVIDRRSR